MTICLRHDCILTERDERVGVKGHTIVHLLRHNMWIRAHGAWVEQTPEDEYVSFYKQAGAPFIADCSVFEKFLLFAVRVLSVASDTQGFDYPYTRLILDAVPV